MGRKIRNTLATLAFMGTLLGAGAASAEQNKYFAGTLTNSEMSDTQIDFNRSDGTKIIGEALLTPWDKEDNEKFALWANSPRFTDANLQVGGETAFDSTADTWGYMGLIKGDVSGDLSLRAGGFQRDDSEGGFAGLKYCNDDWTVDTDYTFDDGTHGVRGFAAGSFNDFYVSVGGDLDQKTLTSVTGFDGRGEIGFYNLVKIDVDDNSQKGKFVLTEKHAKGKGVFDFKHHVYTGTEGMGLGNQLLPYLRGNWAPFDSSWTKGLGGRVNWDHNESSTNVDGIVYYNPGSVFFGIGGGDRVTSGDHDPVVKGEIYAQIPGTPLEAWVDLNLHTETGKLDALTYIGAVGSF